MAYIRDPHATTFTGLGQLPFALCLSGGGLRATFFHFGVVKALAEADRLKDVTDIIAVSGGSILAGHMIANWGSYSGPQKDLATMEKQLRVMAARGMRERVVRRWIARGVYHTLATGFGYFSERRPYTQNITIQGEYERLLGTGTVADCYRDKTDAERPPQVHFMCTNFNSGEACSFTSDEFVIYRKPPTSVRNGGSESVTGPAVETGYSTRKKIRMAVSSDTVELSYAVAASSAFPGLFPAMEITNSKLGASARDFPVTVRLSDGGIYDNLGLEHFKELVRQTERHTNDASAPFCGTHAEAVLVSNASGAFQWDNANDYYGLLPRNLRTIDILMDLMVEERWDQTPDDLNSLSSTRNIHLIRANIGNAIWDAGAPPVSVQQQIQDIRTDLNVFTTDEIDLLIEHGYRTARHEAGVETPQDAQAAVAALYETPAKRKGFRVLDSLVKRATRKEPGLFDWRDPWSVGLGLVLLAGLALVFSPVLAGYTAWKIKQEAKAETSAATERAAYFQQQSKNLEDEKRAFTVKSEQDEFIIFTLTQKVASLEKTIQSKAPAQQVANADIDRAAREVSDALAQATDKLSQSRISMSAPTAAGAPDANAPPLIIIKNSFRVWIQFAGPIKRAEMISFGKALKADKGWTNVPGAEQGGERTENAEGLQEVRYGPSSDRAAAEALTADINSLNVFDKLNPPRRVSIIPKGSLEIWVSR